MIIKVDKRIYSKEVLLKTAYSFTDRVYVHLDQNEDNWIVSWKPKDHQDIDAGEFENELITQTLREDIVRQTYDLRKIILARAYASTVLDDQQGEIDYPEFQNNTFPKEVDLEISSQEEASILRGWFDDQ